MIKKTQTHPWLSQLANPHLLELFAICGLALAIVLCIKQCLTMFKQTRKGS